MLWHPRNKYVLIGFCKLACELCLSDSMQVSAFLLEHRLVDRVLALYLDPRASSILRSVVESCFYRMRTLRSTPVLNFVRDSPDRFKGFA